MNGQNSLVSIGLPVYNGERYLREALDSILSQTYPHFELIISDNASTDATQDICLDYMNRDERIRYIRQQENLGASKNYNLVFERSSGVYFKWAAHDDVCAPELIERCAEVLDRDDTAILCYSRIKEIDQNGKVIQEYPPKPGFASEKAHKRFYECVCIPHPQVAVFGLIRSGILKKSRLIGNYASSDRTLLGELALRGRFVEVPEFFFFRRDHPAQSYKTFRGRHALQAWYDPKKTGRITFPHWRLLKEHLVSINRVPLSLKEKFRCYLYMIWWMRLHWRYLSRNLILTEPKSELPQVYGAQRT